MLFEALFDAYFVALIVFLLTLWYYICVHKPYARFPSCRLEYRIAYWSLIRRPLNSALFQKLVEQFRKHEAEGIFIAWIFKPMVFVYGEEIVKFIVQDPSTINKPFSYKLMEFSMGKGILTSDGDLWKRQKKSISPAFHLKTLKTYVSIMNNNAKTLVEKLSEKTNEPITDISHILSECILRLIYESSLGVREGERKEEEKTAKRVQILTEFFVQRMFSPWLYCDFALHVFPHPRSVLRLDATNKRIFRQILSRIKESVTSRPQSAVKVEEEDGVMDKKPKSFGEILVENHLKLPNFSLKQLANDISVLIEAGFDTSAHALMYTFFALGNNPDIQERLYEEISTVTNEKVEYQDVQDLVYLDCVIKETLRLYSVIPFFSRILDRDVQIGNNLIPKHSEVVVFSYALHRNPKNFPDPEKFNPDRFLDADSKIKPWNYIPFAEGNRPCIGKNYAMLSMKIMMVHVLRKFKIISLNSSKDLQLKWSIVLACEKDPCMKFVSRHKLPR